MDKYRRHPSRPGHWSGGATVPTEKNPSEVEVWFALPPENDGTRVWEALISIMVGPGVAELKSVPALAYGIAFGDRVSVVASGEGPLVATGVDASSECATFRIWFQEAPAENIRRGVVDELARAGCVVDLYSERLIAIGARRALVKKVRALLDEGAIEHGFIWEESRTI